MQFSMVFGMCISIKTTAGKVARLLK